MTRAPSVSRFFMFFHHFRVATVRWGSMARRDSPRFGRATVLRKCSIDFAIVPGFGVVPPGQIAAMRRTSVARVAFPSFTMIAH